MNNKDNTKIYVSELPMQIEKAILNLELNQAHLIKTFSVSREEFNIPIKRIKEYNEIQKLLDSLKLKEAKLNE
jgi:predicted XRE-type DNA-binding protein